MLSIRETELNPAEYAIKSRQICMLIGPQYKCDCSDTVRSSGHAISCVSEVRHLRVFIVSAVNFRCDTSNGKCSSYHLQYLAELPEPPHVLSGRFSW